jgi:hypothetical protein
MSASNVRRLKIEAIGDFAGSKIKPRIRLSGLWLERAGFKPGHWVEISSSKPGELSLQFKPEQPERDDWI